MLHCVPSVFEPTVDGQHASADGQHRYWLNKCLKKAQVPQDRMDGIFGHLDTYKQQCETNQKAIEEALKQVCESSEDAHESTLQALQRAVDEGLKCRVEMLAKVYGELTSPLKCKIASCTIGRE
eukprot:TRINITY_DN2671_c0_g1_i3.p1 TRINITY_DN2671_c0_g1~~TRINITY_DN2671_c0_g1_i3.p1  ORF type:complete len:124 (-),score=35.48 TRINITY_DN2671_c0_g1_i3:279-650(-)